jgi:hypothetical protein
VAFYAIKRFGEIEYLEKCTRVARDQDVGRSRGDDLSLEAMEIKILMRLPIKHNTNFYALKFKKGSLIKSDSNTAFNTNEGDYHKYMAKYS